MTTARYIDELLDRINAEINATGGYSYIVPGEGLITYDVAVIDPITGATEGVGVAGQVVQIKGGSIRIANQKKSNYGTIDDWDFRSVFTADGLNADLITAIHVVAGYIGNATNKNYWNLDSGTLILRRPYHLSYQYHEPWDEDWYEIVETKHDAISISGSSVNTWYDGDIWSQDVRNVGGLLISKKHVDLVHDTTRTDGEIFIVPAHNWTYDYAGLQDDIWSSISASGNLNIFSTSSEDTSRANILLNKKYLSLGFTTNVLSVTRPKAGAVVGERIIEINSDAIKLYAHHRDRNNYSFTGGINICVVDDDSYTGSNQYGINFHDLPIHVTTRNDVNLGQGLDVYNAGSYTYKGSVRATKLNVGTASDTSGHDGGPANGDINCDTIYAKSIYVVDSGTFKHVKSRLVDTDNYGERLLYCYETANPVFGDLGSGSIAADGEAYIALDDMFAEVITCSSYQVFLQKCGSGDLWVKEKHPSYFIVEGTPGLLFDWEIKARQSDFVNTRMEEYATYEMHSVAEKDSLTVADTTEATYGDVLPEVYDSVRNIEDLYNDPIAELEQMYDEERAA